MRNLVVAYFPFFPSPKNPKKSFFFGHVTQVEGDEEGGAYLEEGEIYENTSLKSDCLKSECG